MKQILTLTTLIVIAGMIFYALFIMEKETESVGSVVVGNEYKATTTAPATGGFVENVASPVQVKSGAGQFGSVVILSAGTAGGRYNFYDATTTDVDLRTNNRATSSILITSIPTDLAAGTYTFDTFFHHGLMAEWSGTVGTTTITYR